MNEKILFCITEHLVGIRRGLFATFCSFRSTKPNQTKPITQNHVKHPTQKLQTFFSVSKLRHRERKGKRVAKFSSFVASK